VTAAAGALLRSARTARRLRQWEVVRDTGIGLSRLSALENGAARARPAEVTALAAVLGIDAAGLLRAPVLRSPREPAVPAVLARSFRDIPVTCPCDWLMTFARRRPSGWELAQARPGCAHHGSRR
jgi:transcriptional regulator with XRE-family HTH domain